MPERPMAAVPAHSSLISLTETSSLNPSCARARTSPKIVEEHKAKNAAARPSVALESNKVDLGGIRCLPYLRVNTVKKTLLIATALTASAHALSSAAAQPSSSVLQSLPAEVQKYIEETRASCRSVDIDTLAVTSGDDGLTQFLLGGRKAVLIDPIILCGGCYSQFSTIEPAIITKMAIQKVRNTLSMHGRPR
jgi:hypothetical protein